MDDSTSNDRNDSRKAVDEVLSSGNASISKEDEDVKMPASAAAYGSRVENDEANNDHDAPSCSTFHDELRSSNKQSPLRSRDNGDINDGEYYPSAERLHTNEADEDRKIPAVLDLHQHHSATTTRGRPLQRDQDIDNIGFHSTTSDKEFVPLKVIHVPNNKHHYATFDATKRAPSVPDLTSLQQYQSHNEYRHRHHTRSTTPPPLSDVILKIKERGDQKQQFEERLRRAHLRLSSDNNVIRYRSKSTPSRGGGGGETMTRGNYNNYTHRVYNERRRQSDFNSHVESDSEQHHDGVVFTHQMSRSERHSPAPPLEEMHLKNMHRSSTDPLHVSTSPNEIIPPPSSVKSSGVSVAAGSHRSHGSSFDDRNRSIPEPPPPPPPTTERERLVERERQARLETERARRRHIALQRERQLEEHNDGDNDGVSFDNDGSDDRDALIGQISFEEGNDGIPSPPIPPPPATEKERLVERERQARLETERARRRHLAFQREQQLEMDEHSIGDDDDSHGYHGAIPDNRFSNNNDEAPILEVHPESFVSPIAAARDNIPGSREASTESVASSGTGHGSGAKAVAQNNDAEVTSLSYPMERFLETLGDEPEIPPIVENDESSLPYTMELFLAENAVGVTVDSHRTDDASIEHHGDSNIMASSNSLDLPQPPSPALSTGELSDRDVIENVMPPAFDEALGLNAERPINSDVSNGGSLGDDESLIMADQHPRPPSELRVSPSQPLDDYTLDSPELASAPIRPITEADIAQLAEVEHASIGNAAPQSERDEPSEASIPRRPLLDQAFSVATQTTIIDSVTETSVGRSHLMSDTNQSRDSSNIIRVGGSVETDSSGGASSASIEAVPSNVSNEDSDTDSHLIIHPPSTRSDSHTQSLVDGSNLSTDANLRMPELTEADVVALAEIDYASIGNAPPLSVRDERLSESSVTERGGRQFSVATPISEMESIDENSILRGSPFRSIIDEDSESNLSLSDQDSRLSNESENTSVEVMPSDRSENTGSHNSIEVMLSEQDNDFLHDDGRVRDIDAMASGISVGNSHNEELGNNLDDMNGGNHRLSTYGATSKSDDGAGHYNRVNPRFNDGQDEESAPLIPSQHNTALHLQGTDKSSQGDTIGNKLIFLAAEIPHFIIVVRGHSLLCPMVGARRYQIILAVMIILASVYSRDRSDEMKAECLQKHSNLMEIALIGAFIGMLGLITSGWDTTFALGVIGSVTIAIAVSKFCGYHAARFLKRCRCRSKELRGVVAMACCDFVRSFMLMSSSYVIFNFIAPLSIDEEDTC